MEKFLGTLEVRQYSCDPFCDRMTGWDLDHFAIEVPEEERYMTQQECSDWVCLHGYKGYQVKFKHDKFWVNPAYYGYFDFDISKIEYRTIKEVDGKIVYGEPQEFKVKVSDV